MNDGDSDERVYPSDRVVADIMNAAQPATEKEVIECLQYLYEERGLRPGTRTGPHHFSWFRTVVGDFSRNVSVNFPPQPPLRPSSGNEATSAALRSRP
jgi:hypothetical protein